MRKKWILIYISIFFLFWKFFTGFFYHFDFDDKTERPNFEPSYIIFRKGNSLPLFGAIQSQNRFHGKSVIQYNLDIETKARGISKQSTKQITIPKHSLHYMIWTEICKNKLENLLYQPLFPHLPTVETITTTLELNIRDQSSGVYIFGKILPPTTGFYILHVSSEDVNFQVWISENEDPAKATLILQNDRSMTESMELKSKNAYYIGIVFTSSSASGKFSLEWNIPGENKIVQIRSSFIESYEKTSPLYQEAISQNIPILYEKIPLADMYSSKTNKNRYQIFKLPFIPQKDVEGLFPTCDYHPSYLIDKKLERYAGQWETHFTSIYPEDETDMLMYHQGVHLPQIIYGNPVLKRDIAESVVTEVIDAIHLKHK